MNQQLRAELERLGKNVDQLLATKGSLASSLEQARSGSKSCAALRLRRTPALPCSAISPCA